MNKDNVKVTDADNEAKAKEIQENAMIVGDLLQKIPMNPKLMDSIFQASDKNDAEFGVVVNDLIIAEYPDYKDKLDPTTSISIGRCVCQMINFREEEKEQLDSRFEVDYLKRIQVLLDDHLNTQDTLNKCNILFHKMEADIRYIKTGIGWFNIFRQTLTNFVAEANNNKLELPAVESKFADIIVEYNKKVKEALDRIAARNTNAVRKFEKFQSVDYARRIEEIWAEFKKTYIEENNVDKMFDTEYYNKFLTQFSRLYNDIGVDDREADERMIPIVNRISDLLGSICRNIFITINQQLPKEEIMHKHKEDIPEAFRKLDERLCDIVTMYAAEPPAEYTGK